MKKGLLLLTVTLLVSSFCHAEVTLSNVFGDNMVLQRDKTVKIWGWAAPGEKIQVSFSDQNVQTQASSKGEWQVSLKPMSVNCTPQTLKVTGAENQVVCSNILLGDIWLLGGQSNMEFDLEKVFDGDLEVLASNNDQIRLMTIPHANAGREGLKNVERFVQYNSWSKVYEDKGCWFPCYADKVRQFSAIGYMFGKTIQEITHVPVGLVDASRGGTTIESWLSPKMLAATPEDGELMKMWNKKDREYDAEAVLKQAIKNWEARSESRRKQGLEPGPKPTEAAPGPSDCPDFPGACYNGMIAPLEGLAMKGIIFNHGYNNALGDARPKLYAVNFNALIKDWRNSFNDQELPFGIIELTAGGGPQTMDNYEAMMLDAAPFIREGQHQAYLNNKYVGYCCAYDQQVSWYHPQKKLPLGVRMARWALAEVYGYKNVVWEPAKVLKTEKTSDGFIVTFDKEVRGSDDRPIEGFAIAGEDRHFYPAKAVYVEKGKDNRGNVQYDKKKLIVSNPLVTDAVAIRYAWARNPLANMVSDRIIPIPLFRTDYWDHMEAPYLDGRSEGFRAYKSQMGEISKKTQEFIKTRKLQEAEFILNNK